MKPRFISVRDDGLGSRLRSLLTAFALAKECGGEFEFAWPSNPNSGSGSALGTVEDIFSDEFLDLYHRPGWLDIMSFRRNQGQKTKNYRAHVLYNDKIPDLLESGNSSQICHIPVFEDLRVVLDRPGVEGLYQDTFSALLFSKKVMAAIRAARDLPIPNNCTAIHMRAGDIVESGFRFTGQFTQWVLPFPLVCHLSEREQKAGHSVIIFGQDAASIRHVCATTGAMSASNISDPDFDSIQRWFFEICLMARCQRIISGGRSAFSQLASWIGVTPNENGYDLVTGKTALAATKSEIATSADTSNLQKAFSYWAVSYMYASDIPPEEIASCLEEAVANDKDNSLYKLAQVNALVAIGCHLKASRLLNELIESEANEQERLLGSLRWVLLELSWPEGEPVRNTVLSNFKGSFLAKNPGAILCQALASNDQKKVESTASLIERQSWIRRRVFRLFYKQKL